MVNKVVFFSQSRHVRRRVIEGGGCVFLGEWRTHTEACH